MQDLFSDKKDWTGDRNSVYKTLGASSHTKNDREQHDYYATDPKALKLLLKLETFSNVWEVSCGEGHLSKVLIENNIHGRSTDLIDRGFGEHGFDFLAIDNLKWGGDIITNPPYKLAQEFVEKSMEIIDSGSKVAMFLKLQFLEGKARRKLFTKYPPKTIYVSSSRLLCAKNADFKGMIAGGGSAVAYCWYIWQKGYNGETIIKWFN